MLRFVIMMSTVPRSARPLLLAVLASLAGAATASAAPGISTLSSLDGLTKGSAFTLSFTASDPARPMSGFAVDFGEPDSAVGESACNSGAPVGAFTPGRSSTFSEPYTFATSGIHIVTLRVISGGCDGNASSTVVRKVVTISPPKLPIPLPLARAARRRAGCRWTTLMPRRGNEAKIDAATLCLVNRQRARAGLHALRRNGELQRAANGHSVVMVRRGVFAHGSVVNRLRAVHYVTPRVAWTIGENLAYGIGSYATAARTVTNWMHSPPHRANILTRSFRDAGVGLVLGVPGDRSRGATYTLDFGTRR